MSTAEDELERQVNTFVDTRFRVRFGAPAAIKIKRHAK
jgi:hypothetical protein